MKALVLSDGAGTRSRPCMPPSATSSLSVADPAVLRAPGSALRDGSTDTRVTRTVPRALPHLIEGKVRVGS
ncbi:hypothetical protein ACFY94_04130 [Streptomyces griseorubiginosus]|uniref:hypothetical protein n=1 Tax=Streptomyces griseorubiginosus TaxID=67304 RepID=UPI0036EB137B